LGGSRTAPTPLVGRHREGRAVHGWIVGKKSVACTWMRDHSDKPSFGYVVERPSPFGPARVRAEHVGAVRVPPN
jgi:hypothetical protein